MRLSVVGVVAAMAITIALSVTGGPEGSTPLATQNAQGAQPKTLKLIWGGNTLPNGTSAFPTYKRLGVDVLQVQLSWAGTAATRPADPRDPNDPAYAWPKALDTAVAGAQASGISVALLVRQTPGWANGGQSVARVPTDVSDYADFLVAAAKRYPGVRRWMIWGEPTREGNFEPMPANKPTGPRRYAQLLDASYGALKGVSKRNVVIGGMTWTLGLVTPVDFVRWMRLPNGKAPRLDYYGHNPYSTRFPNIASPTYYKGLIDISDVDTLHKLLKRAYPQKTPKLWLSEFSIADKKNRAFDFAVSRTEQARWLTAAYKLAASQSYVAGLGWYTLVDEPRTVKDAITNGLLTDTGAEKPAFKAYQRVP
ncbi:MAG: hypothetical protein JWO02_3868 [Solirubrobacterales bacterium]|nr:hypothetical protein [Solirubrobacterales bacterium]